MRNTTGKSTSRNTLLTTVLIALFAALSYVVLYIKIPMGEQFVHMGNMVTILAALLIGGWQGGLSGSIGMGLYDIFFYPTSVVKTLILKFGIGLSPASSPESATGIPTAAPARDWPRHPPFLW